MASRSTKNEKQILTAKYLKEKISKDELVNRLKNVSEKLREIDQEQSAELDELAFAIAAPTFIRHRDKEVKVLTASCLADIMRIYAPDAPYDDNQLQTIFTFFIAQLRGLEDPNGPLFSRYFYLLEHLAVVKAFVVIVGFDTDDLAIDLFRTLFEVSSDSLSNKVKNHMVDVMVTVLEESDTISQEMLDVVLENLGESAKKDNPSAYRLTQSVIEKSSNRLEPFVANFLNDIIMNGSSGESELADDAYNLIYELNQINSVLLLHVLPNLVTELKVDDNVQRSEAVKLLGRMFASKGSKLGSNYNELFAEFLRRFSDKDHNIRMMMVAFGKHFLINQPELAPQISDILLHRIQDPDEKMRKAVVSCVADAALANPDGVDAKLLEAVGHRTRDKKIMLRNEAVEQLAKVYQSQSRDSDLWGEDDLKKFGSIPNTILHTFYVADSPIFTKYKLLSILDEKLIANNADVETRGRLLLQIHRNLDPRACSALEKIMDQKKKFQTWMKEYLEARREFQMEYKELGQLDQSEAMPKLLSKIKLVSSRIPDIGKGISAETALSKLAKEVKDNRVFYNLSILCSSSTTYSGLLIAKEEVLQRIGSANPIIPYVKAITSMLSTAFISSDSIPVIVDCIEQSIEAEDIAEAMNGLNLLLSVSKPFPEIIVQVAEKLLPMLRDENAIIVTTVLSILDRVSKYTVDGTSPLTDNVRKQLQNILPTFYNEGLPLQGKHAVNIIVSLFKDSGEAAPILTEFLSESVVEFQAMDFLRLSTTLTVMGRIALLLPEVFMTEANEIVTFIVKDLLANKHGAEDKFDDELGWEKDAKVASVKVLVNYIMPLQGDERSLASPPVIRLLLRLIRDHGRLTKQRTISPTLADALHLAGVKGLVKLCTNAYYDRLVGPDEFLSLAMASRSESSVTRKALLDKLIKHLQELQLPLRFGAILPLYCSDSDSENVQTAKTGLHAFGRTRRDLLGRAGPKASGSITQATFMPEYSLPYFVFILAHLPDFPKEFTESSVNVIVKPINFYYSEILKLGQNVPFIRQLLDTMKQTRDAIDRESNNIHIVIELAMLVLRRKMDNKAYLDAGYPGEIRIPRNFFTVAADGRTLATTTFLPAEVITAIQEKGHRTTEALKSPGTPSRKRKSSIAPKTKTPPKRAKTVQKGKGKGKGPAVPKDVKTKKPKKKAVAKKDTHKSRQRTIEELIEKQPSSQTDDSIPSETTKEKLDTSKPLELSDSDSEEDEVPRRARRRVRR